MEGKFVDFETGIWVPQDNQFFFSSRRRHTRYNYGNVYGVQQQAGASATQSASINLAHINQILEQLTSVLRPLDRSTALKEEVETEIETVRRETKRSRPNIALMRAAAIGLQTLAMGLAGNMLTPYVQQCYALWVCRCNSRGNSRQTKTFTSPPHHRWRFLRASLLPRAADDD